MGRPQERPWLKLGRSQKLGRQQEFLNIIIESDTGPLVWRPLPFVSPHSAGYDGYVISARVNVIEVASEG